MERIWLVVTIALPVLAVFALLVRIAIREAQTFRIERRTTLSANEALDQLQQSMVAHGWIQGYRDRTSLVMTKPESADVGGTILLGIISFWLAVLNILSSNKTITLSIEAAETGPYTTVVVEGSRSGIYVKNAKLQLEALPRAYSAT